MWANESEVLSTTSKTCVPLWALEWLIDRKWAWGGNTPFGHWGAFTTTRRIAKRIEISRHYKWTHQLFRKRFEGPSIRSLAPKNLNVCNGLDIKTLRHFFHILQCDTHLTTKIVHNYCFCTNCVFHGNLKSIVFNASLSICHHQKMKYQIIIIIIVEVNLIFYPLKMSRHNNSCKQCSHCPSPFKGSKSLWWWT